MVHLLNNNRFYLTEMIGAIIGDLAAWTYENDKDTFWNQLIPSDFGQVELSVFGNAYLRATLHNLFMDLSRDVDFTTQNSECSPKGNLIIGGQWLMWQLVCAWQDNLESPIGQENHYAVDKEKACAKSFMVGLIKKLRNGYTKNKAYHSEALFEQLSKTWHWKKTETLTSEKRYGLLTHVFRAWDSFYRGFDFTSSIHNAVRWEGSDRHLLTMLTASFASAMYGCKYNLIKNKYAINNNMYHMYNVYGIVERFGYDSELCSKMTDKDNSFRTFFAKNMSLTNVERHSWQDIANSFDHLCFAEDEYKRILKCSPTSWDNRYGLYLDDGWMYVYRSGCLIGRFQLTNVHGAWMITNTQLSGEKPWHEFCNALFCALVESCDIRIKPH